MKTCARCGIPKPPDQFAGRWGQSPYCQTCYPLHRKEVDRAIKATPELLARSADRRRARYRTDPEYAESARERARQYRRDHPDRRAAQNAVYNATSSYAPTYVYAAVKHGKLHKEPCAVCGDPNSQGHHHRGYDAAHRTDVVWLCPIHHAEVHHDNVT